VAGDSRRGLPGRKEDVGAEHENAGEEAGPLDRRFASGEPGRVEQFEYGVPKGAD
jgi:hypothetical protein